VSDPIFISSRLIRFYGSCNLYLVVLKDLVVHNVFRSVISGATSSSHVLIIFARGNKTIAFCVVGSEQLMCKNCGV
jgi:hypothetical protein